MSHKLPVNSSLRALRPWWPHVCTTCPDPHVDNCPLCFGYGLNAQGGPLSASAAYSSLSSGEWKECPECGGVPPRDPKAEQAAIDAGQVDEPGDMARYAVSWQQGLMTAR